LNKVINFHLPADDVERAAAFYKKVFGWEFAPFPNSPIPYFTIEAEAAGGGGAGIPVAITSRQEIVKVPVPTIEVEHIDQAMTDIAVSGGQQGRVSDLPGLGRFGYAIDSEGNVIALLQRVV
jgi:uncharacterized protein